MKLKYEKSCRHDFSSYAILIVGLIFMWAGMTADPELNCEMGLDCDPLESYIGIFSGFLIVIYASFLIIKNWVINREWENRLDLHGWVKKLSAHAKL